MPLAKGTHVGPYEIAGWLGAGGMGDVYRARDSRLGRDVAVKVIAEAFAEDAEPGAALRAGGPGRQPAQPPQHPRRLRRRHAITACRTSSPSCSTASRFAAGCTPGPLPWRKARRLRPPDRRGAGRRPRQAPRSPRREAREPVHHERRPDQDPRLRHRQADTAGRRGAGTRRGRHEDPDRRRARHRGLYVAPAGLRRSRGRPVRLFSLGAVLYEMLAGPSGLRSRDVGRDHGGGADRGPAPPGRPPALARARRVALPREVAACALPVGP